MSTCVYSFKGKKYNEHDFNQVVAEEYMIGKKLSSRPVGSPITSINNFSELYEAFSGKIIVDGESNGLSIDDKVELAYQRMLNNNVEQLLDLEDPNSGVSRRKVIQLGGESFDYTDVPQMQWKEMIRERLLSKLDVKGSLLKDGLVDLFNSGVTVHNVEAFNSIFSENERFFSKEDLERVLKAFNYAPHKSYMTLYQAIEQGIIKDISTNILGDYNPLVSVEEITTNEGAIYKLELFQVTRSSLFKIADDSQRTNILANISGVSVARKNGVFLNNSYTNKQSILMNLLSNMIARTNRNITMGESVIVQVNPFGDNPKTKVVPTSVDHIASKFIQRKMMHIPEMHQLLPDEIQSHFVADNENNMEGNYLKFLLNFYEEDGGVGEDFSVYRPYFINDFKRYMDFGADFGNKARLINHLNRRLSYLHRQARRYGTSYLETVEASAEYKYLVDAISALQNLDTFSYQLNDMKDVSMISSYIRMAVDIGHETFQQVQKIVGDTSMEVVAKMKDFNKEFESKFFDVHLKHNTNLGALRNENYFMYEKSLATVDDINGNKRYAGYLLWTTDHNHDPLFARQAQEKLANGELTHEELQANKWMVEQITERYVDSLMHRYEMSHGSLYSKQKGGVLSREDFKRKLFEETSYKRGMLPIIPKRKGEYLYKGKPISSLKRQWQTINREEDFSELLNITKDEDGALLIDDMNDTFYEQIAVGSNSHNNKSFLGSANFLNKIGLQTLSVKGQEKVATLDDDGTANNSFSHDLQMAIKSFMLVGYRKQLYESKALPIVNALYFNEKLGQDYKNFDNKNVIRLIQDYMMKNARNESNHLKGNENVEKAILTLNKLGTARVMLFNLSIGQVSAIANLNSAILEATANDLSGSFKFGHKEIWNSTAKFFSEYGKMSQLAQRFQVVNSSEMETLTHFFMGYKGNKQILSQFMASLPNWATDYFARIVVMGAQMMKDGTYDAYVYDKETGEVHYDESLDSRWDGEEGLARRDYIIENQIVDGIEYDSQNDVLKDAYMRQEMKNLKWLSDKYIIMGYDNVTADVAGITVLGKLMRTFRTYMLSKAGIIYKKAEFSNMGGRVVMVKDQDGSYVGKWERSMIEGFANTWIRAVGTAIGYGGQNPLKLKNMTTDEKTNMVRGAAAVSMFTLITFLFNALVDGDDDNPYDLIDHKTGKQKYLPGIRFYKNFKYSASSLLLIEDTYKFFQNPFTGMNIINNFFFNFVGEFDTKQLKKGAEVWNGLDVAYELMEVIVRGSEELSLERKEEKRRKAQESREKNKDKRERIEELKRQKGID